MNNELLNKLIKKNNLGLIKEEPKRVTGGLLNRMYKVVITSGTYAIKHLNPEVMKRKGALENHIIAEEIANVAKENGISAISAYIFNDGALQEIDGNFFFIYDWFDGEVVLENQITFEQINKIASITSKLHNIDFGDIKERCKHKTDITEINWDFYIQKIENQEIKNFLMANKETLALLDKKSTIYAKELQNNMVISHRDLDLPNILWDKENNPVIIDWESSGFVNPCEEVIETAWDWSGGQRYFDIEKFKYFLQIYEKNGGNLEDYNKAIYSNFKNKSGWLEYNLKRVCRIECIDEEEHKLGEKEVIRVVNEIIFFYQVLTNRKD